MAGFWLDVINDIDDHRVYYLGTSNRQCQNGVGLIIWKTIVGSPINFVVISERLLLLQTNAKSTQMNVLQVYTPTKEQSDEESGTFYSKIIDVLNNSQIMDVLNELSKKDFTIIIGDFQCQSWERIWQGMYKTHVVWVKRTIGINNLEHFHVSMDL